MKSSSPISYWSMALFGAGLKITSTKGDKYEEDTVITRLRLEDAQVPGYTCRDDVDVVVSMSVMMFVI